MKLKLVKGPRPGQMDMVAHTEFGTYSIGVGETIEVSDEAGHAIMAKWAQCFKMVTTAPKKKKEASAEENKMEASYENKKL